MRGRNLLKKIGGFILAAILVSGIAVFASDTTQAQGRGFRRRVVIVRPYRFYNPWSYRRFGYYDSFRYNQYVFDNGDKAVSQGYSDGYKTGKDDGKKSKSYSPERSHYFHDSGFGNFAEAYRSGFSNGYREGYNVGSNGVGR
ncbi:MAG TPA: hypothetical protein VGN86_01720 [Pyrinomonadaceae bacterium]|jgi:hypothetical protein|nr:hypothetical protein [Pyrinomonadaceae bacterium]